MKQLKELLKYTKVESIHGIADVSVHALTSDSRRINKGAAFFALKGENFDGHDFVPAAAEAGASVVVVSNARVYEGVTTVCVNDTAEAMGNMARVYYDDPTSKLKLIGITGTNGKTTTATLLYKLFMQLGYKTGLISTVANYVEEKKLQTKYTTPDVLALNRLLRQMSDTGCQYCFAEISSHALEQKRTAGLKFAGAVFANITHDHLDYHKTFKNYIYAKKKLFDNLDEDAFALVNADDRNADVMLQNCKARKHKFAVKSIAEFQSRIIENSFEGMKLEIDEREVWTLLSGEFNAYNITAVYAAARLLGVRKQELLPLISAFTPVRGRMESFNINGITAIVDYAHTPDALENVLRTIQDVKTPAQKLITVVGTGGNRDKEKRPKMARIAFEHSDKVIFTSDNPRFEKPTVIIEDMIAGLSPQEQSETLNIPDRKEALKTAVMIAQTGDIVLVAGKGHETYQEIKGIRSRFDDKEILTEFLENLKKN